VLSFGLGGRSLIFHAVYGLREVDENGIFLPDKKKKFTILVVPDRSINEEGRIIRIEDKAYPLAIPERMKPKRGLIVFFDDSVGLSEISDAKSGEVVALYNPLTGHFPRGGPEDIFEKAQ